MAACVDILRAWIAETPWISDPRTPHEQARDWRGFFKYDLAWVAQSKSRIIGFCSRGNDNINGLYVAADWRSQGVGRRLLDMAKADRDWITVWAYQENTQALKFYKREGLVEIGREIEDGSNLVDIEHRWTRQNDPVTVISGS